MAKVLVIGFGNPGRRDDGLGPALAALIARRKLPGVTVDSDYQLQVEDAAAIAEHDVVVFADASVDGPGPFSWRRLEPQADLSFTSHSVSPEALLHMAHDVFHASTEGYLLAIRGHEFEGFGEGLSTRAAAHLASAAAYLERVLREGRLDRSRNAADESCAASSTTRE